MSSELITLETSELILIEVSDTQLELIELATQGPQGVQGPAGPESTADIAFAIVFGG